LMVALPLGVVGKALGVELLAQPTMSAVPAAAVNIRTSRRSAPAFLLRRTRLKSKIPPGRMASTSDLVASSGSVRNELVATFVVSVRVVVAGAVPVAVTVLGLKVQVELTGMPEQVNVTVPAKPLIGAIARVAVPVEPPFTVRTGLEVLKAKFVFPPIGATLEIDPKSPCCSASRPAAK